MSNRTLAPLSLGLGLIFIFIGERHFGGTLSVRLGLDVLGAALLVLSGVLRPKTTGPQIPVHVKQWMMSGLLMLFIALGLYAFTTDELLEKIGSKEAQKNIGVVLGVLWPILLGVSSSMLLFLDLSLFSARFAPALEEGRIRGSAQVGTVLALLLAIFGGVNYVGSTLDWEKDLSRRKVGEPSASLVDMVLNSEKPLYATAFYPTANEVAEEIGPYFRALEKKAPGKFFFDMVDQAFVPKVAQKLGVSDNGSIVFSNDDPNAEPAEEAETTPEAKKSPHDKVMSKEVLRLSESEGAARSTLKKLDSEVQKSIIKLAKASKTLYFTEGHGERDARGGSNVDESDPRGKMRLMGKVITQLSHEIKKLTAATGLAHEIPEDADVVVVAGTSDHFDATEVEAIKKYFEAGGALYIMLEPGKTAPTELLEYLGLEFDPTIAVNAENAFFPMKRAPSDRAILATNKTSTHASVTTLSRYRQRLVAALPNSGSLRKKDGTQLNVQLTLKSMPGTFKDANGNFTRDDKEKVEELGFVAAIEGKSDKADQKAGRAVVIANTEAFSDEYIRNAGNQVLFMDGLQWLIGKEDVAAPVALDDEDKPIRAPKSQEALIFWSLLLGMPAIVLGGGLTFVNRNRRRRGGAA